MAYLNLKEYQKAIDYLEQFSADDVLLSALAKGAIGDAHAALGNNEKALASYKAAIGQSDNSFTTPKYLFKAGLLSSSLGQNKDALDYFKRIEEEYPDAVEARQIGIQIGRLAIQ